MGTLVTFTLRKVKSGVEEIVDAETKIDLLIPAEIKSGEN